MANRACTARVLTGRVYFEGAEVNALVAAAGEVLRTAEPRFVHYGLAQVRRGVEAAGVRMLHVVFAPARARPLLLGLVRIENPGSELVQLDYTELWEVTGVRARAAEGACVCDTPGGERALADLASAIRGRAPRPPSQGGLSLTLRLALPPGERRQLTFAYAAPAPDESAAVLVRAWRGDVAGELMRTTRYWLDSLRESSNPLEAYRIEAARWPV